MGLTLESLNFVNLNLSLSKKSVLRQDQDLQTWRVVGEMQRARSAHTEGVLILLATISSASCHY